MHSDRVTVEPQAPAAQAAWLIVAAACSGLALGLACQYPVLPGAAVVLVLIVGFASFRWPRHWPLTLPALLPVIGLAPWTGWLTFEEWDLLVLAIAAGGYLRGVVDGRAGHDHGVGMMRSKSKSAPLMLGLLTAYGTTMAVSMLLGFADAGGFRWGLFQGYREPMNSLRLAKPFFAMLLLAPLWLAALRRDSEGTSRRLATGLVLGLLGTALAATWERLAFTDLLNFSTDYRTTALFWEMHVGGAALDGMLALTLPFLVHELLAANTRQRWLAMAAILPLAGYACLTTFSRGVYLAVPVGVALMFVLHARQARHTSTRSVSATLVRGLPAVALVAAFAAAAMAMFPTSGYRGLIGLLAASAVLLALPRLLRAAPRAQALQGLVAGLLLCGLCWAMALVLPKGAYLAYALATAVAAGALLMHLRPNAAGLQHHAPALALAGLVAMLASLLLVARHWGGDEALPPAQAVVAALAALLLAASFSPRVVWPAQPRWQAGTACALVLTAGVVAAFGGGAYMGDRFATGSSDFQGRVQHWKDGLSLLRTPVHLLFGRGLGRFVDNHAFTAAANARPGDYRLRNESSNTYVTLVAGTHELGWGEVMRLSQRIPAFTLPAFVEFDVRTDQALLVHLEVCAKHLLYDGGCLVQKAHPVAKPGVWQTMKLPFAGTLPDPGPWYAPRLMEFSIALESPGQRADIDNLRLVEADGRDLLSNGDFSSGLARWFMTSDRYHLPWHMKNLAAHVLFDQGFVGLALLGLMVALALLRTTLTGARHHRLAPGVAGGLAGFLVVGMFDSLLDMPRVAFLFYFLVLLGLTLKAPAPRDA